MCKIPTESPEEKAAFDAITRNQSKPRMSLQEFFEAGYKLHAGDIYTTLSGKDVTVSEIDVKVCGSEEVTNDDKRYIVKSKELAAATAKEDSQEWVNGLPPVGETVMGSFHYDQKSMEEWVIDYITKEVGVYTQVKSGKQYTFSTDSVFFRPTETPEQKAARERIETLNDMYDITRELNYVDGCAALYDAGYRKPAHKDNK